MTELPKNLYTAEQTRELDRVAIEDCEIPGTTLMARAADATFNILSEKWPEANSVIVFCGNGNNAGDGFVLARLAENNRLKATVVLVGSADVLSGDALEVYNHLQGTQVTVVDFDECEIDGSDVIVDALFGSGLCREVEGR